MGNKPSRKQNQEKKLKVATNTGILSLQNQKLKRIPNDVYEKGKLRTLNLSQNKIFQVPRTILRLVNLRTLNVSLNALDPKSCKKPGEFPFPDDLTPLVKLEKLVLDGNRLRAISSKLPTSLLKISAASNCIDIFPSHIYSLSRLKEIDLSDNQLANLGTMPSAPAPKLQTLLLSGNKVGTLPATCKALGNLRHIDLSHNALMVIPSSMFTETKLHRIDLQGNRFSKESLQKMEGFPAFAARRKVLIDKNIAGGVRPNTSLCGMD